MFRCFIRKVLEDQISCQKITKATKAIKNSKFERETFPIRKLRPKEPVSTNIEGLGWDGNLRKCGSKFGTYPILGQNLQFLSKHKYLVNHFMYTKSRKHNKLVKF